MQVILYSSISSEISFNSLCEPFKILSFGGIILGLGFIVFAFSQFVPNHEFGILATIILAIALDSSMTLLPVLINYTKPKIRFKSK